MAPDRLRIGVEAAPATLDPRHAADAHSSRVAGLVHCALVEPGADGTWRPSLAASWSSPTPTTRVFELKPGARFHDGTPVTADDVVATWRSVLDPATASPKRAALATVASPHDIAADGPLRVTVKLARPDPAFLDGASVGVLPATLAARARVEATDVVGCGPYRVASFDERRVLLDAFDGWHEGPPSLRAIEVRVVPDTVMRTLQLRSGDLDLVQNALEPDAARHLASAAPHLRVTTTPYDAFQYVGINHRHPALRDVRVRRAIAHAIDREAIVEHVLDGQADVASGLVPPHQAAHESRVRRYPHDVARAKALLDEAGWPDPDGDGPLPRLQLRWATSTVELRRRLAEVFAAQLAAVGIHVRIESWEWGTFFADIARGDYDLYSLAWIGIRDPDLMRTAFHSAMTPPAGANRGFFSNARMDRLTDRARTETDAARRRRLYARVQKLAARRLPYVPLWWPRNVVVVSERVAGFTPHPAGDLGGLAHAELR